MSWLIRLPCCTVSLKSMRHGKYLEAEPVYEYRPDIVAAHRFRAVANVDSKAFRFIAVVRETTDR